jgi:NAD(P)-dependent dehydrogenase (short-subunit alcohol dehydrogenase family)
MSMLAGKRVLVLGGSKGLGLASARDMLRSGAAVAIAARSAGPLAEAEAELASLGRVVAIRCNATDEGDVGQAFASAVEALGGLDTVVVSAGRSMVGDAEELPHADFLAVLGDNLSPLFLAAKIFPRHCAPEGGSLIAFSSVFGVVGYPKRVAYAAAKAAMIGMVRSIALDLAPRNIRVNAISPSLVLTPQSRAIIAAAPDPAAALASRVAQHPLGRAGEEHEIGSLVAFLASDGAAWITGQNYIVDGGLSAA